MREHAGSARNLHLGITRNAQQDTKTQCFLLVYSYSAAKVVGDKLGRFSSSFAEKTVEKELRNRSPLAVELESIDNLSSCREKVKPETGNLSTFF